MATATPDFLDPTLFASGEFHDAMTALRAEPTLHWQADNRMGGFWNLVKHADVVEVSRDTETFSSEWGGTQILTGLHPSADNRAVIMLDMDPPRHTRFRLLVNRGFTPRMVALLEQTLAARAERIVDHVVERGEADFVTDVASELPLQALAEILGVPQEDRFKMFDWSNRLIGVLDPEYGGEGPMVAVAELGAYTEALAEQRRVDPRDDIVTKLLTAEVDGDHLTSLEFQMFMLLLVVAGNETTRNATTGGVLALLRNPDQLAYVRDDLDARLPAAIEELLRWTSPVIHFRRTATRDVELRGTQIRQGDAVVLWYPSANRDEEVFADPFTLDLTRDPNPHVAFGGGGPHFCLGAHLARTELRLILQQVLTRLDDLELTGEPDPLQSNFIGGIKHLPMRWTPGTVGAPTN